MITLSRTKTVTIPFMGVEVIAEFNVPTAEEVEAVFRGSDVKNLKDTDVFKRFTVSLKSEGIDGWADGVSADAAAAAPGTFSLVGKVVTEITKAAIITEPEKN